MAKINLQTTEMDNSSYQLSNDSLSPSRKESETISQSNSIKVATASTKDQNETRSAQTESNIAYIGKTTDKKKKL